MTGERLLVKHRLYLGAQAIEAAAHVRHARRNPYLRSRLELDHR